MAQNEDDAIQRHRDICMVMPTTQIKSTERLVDLKMKMSERMGDCGSEAHTFMAINSLTAKSVLAGAKLILFGR